MQSLDRHFAYLEKSGELRTRRRQRLVERVRLPQPLQQPLRPIEVRQKINPQLFAILPVRRYLQDRRPADLDSVLLRLARNFEASVLESHEVHVQPPDVFIARRIVIFASEDVGLADPEALQLAIATQQAVEFVGMPEARIPLAHATAYMCRAAKSREAYDELNAATEKIEMEQTQRVPENLKNKHFPINPER